MLYRWLQHCEESNCRSVLRIRSSCPIISKKWIVAIFVNSPVPISECMCSQSLCQHSLYQHMIPSYAVVPASTAIFALLRMPTLHLPSVSPVRSRALQVSSRALPKNLRQYRYCSAPGLTSTTLQASCRVRFSAKVMVMVMVIGRAVWISNDGPMLWETKEPAATCWRSVRSRLPNRTSAKLAQATKNGEERRNVL
jgi:hypothetical protein